MVLLDFNSIQFSNPKYKALMLRIRTQVRWLLSIAMVMIIFVGIVSCTDAVCCSQDKCPHSIEEESVVELVMNFEALKGAVDV